MLLHFGPRIGGRTPAYPTRLAVMADPRLLLRHLPHAWLQRPEYRRGLALLAGTGLLVNSGCVTATPPPTMGLAAFPPAFSEAAALEIIKTELAARGIQGAVEKVTLPGVTVAGHNGTVPFVADVADPGGNWSIDYLSLSELFDYQIPEDRDLEMTAERVRAEVALQVPNRRAGVFYTVGRGDWKTSGEERADLQQQVQEFLDWLAAQGVI